MSDEEFSEESEGFEEDLPPAPEGCRTVLAKDGALYNAFDQKNMRFFFDPNGERPEDERFHGNVNVFKVVLGKTPEVEPPQEQLEEVIPEPPPGALVFRRKRK
jgi:hypothetical protein